MAFGESLFYKKATQKILFIGSTRFAPCAVVYIGSCCGWLVAFLSDVLRGKEITCKPPDPRSARRQGWCIYFVQQQFKLNEDCEAIIKNSEFRIPNLKPVPHNRHQIMCGFFPLSRSSQTGLILRR